MLMVNLTMVMRMAVHLLLMHMLMDMSGLRLRRGMPMWVVLIVAMLMAMGDPGVFVLRLFHQNSPLD